MPYARYGESLESVEAAIAALPAGVTREGLQGLLPAWAARNAVDCALWDREAKRTGRAAWQLAGLAAPRPLVAQMPPPSATPSRVCPPTMAPPTR